MSMGFGFEEASRACWKWFYEDFEEVVDGVAVARHGIEEEADGLDERERIVNYTTGQFFKNK